MKPFQGRIQDFFRRGALVSCSTSTPINHIVFFLQNTSCIRKPQVISGVGGGGGAPPPPPPSAHPLHPPPRSAPALIRSEGMSIWGTEHTRRACDFAYFSSVLPATQVLVQWKTTHVRIRADFH